MSQNVNGKMFKNNNQGGKKKVNPVIPLIFVIVLALALVAIQWFVLDLQSAAYEQQSQQQTEQQTGN